MLKMVNYKSKSIDLRILADKRSVLERETESRKIKETRVTKLKQFLKGHKQKKDSQEGGTLDGRSWVGMDGIPQRKGRPRP